MQVNLGALTFLGRQVFSLHHFSFSCCFNFSSETPVTAWDTPQRDAARSNAPASAIFFVFFFLFNKTQVLFEGASAQAWAAGVKTFKQAARLDSPRVVWSSPGCRIKIWDQTKFWLSVINEESVMGNTCPAARACWQAATTLVPE